MVGRAGHQGQGRVVVAGQNVLLVAAGRLELQGQQLDALTGALPPLLLVGDALGEIFARIGGRAPQPAGPRPAPAGASVAGGAGAGCGTGRAGRWWRVLRVGPRLRRRPAGGRRRLAGGRVRAGRRRRLAARRRLDTRVVRPARRPAPRAPFRRAAALRLGFGALGRHRVEHRPDVEAGGLAEVAGLAAVVPGHRDDQVVAVDHDLGTGDAQPVDPRADDLLRLRQRFPARPRPVGRARGQRDPGAALQVDAELGSGPLVPGQKHQQVNADEHEQENRQVAGRVHRRRRRCHVPFISLRIGFLPRQSLRVLSHS